MSDAELTETALAPMLHGLDGRLRAGRERLVRELIARGYSIETLRSAHAEDRLAVLLLEDALRSSASLTARDVALDTGFDVSEVLQTWHLLGLGTVGSDEPAFDDLACEAMRTMTLTREYGLSQAARDELLVVLGRHMWQLAADLEVIVGNELGRPGDTEYELAHRYADAGRVLAPTAIPLVSAVFAAHLRERMRDIFVTAEEAEVGALRATTNMAVAFVDVVGFTSLGERVDAGELKSIATRLVAVADDIVELPVRVVKTVGDALLLMSRDPTTLVATLAAINRAAAAHPLLPAVHSGVAYGTAHVGGADIFGAPVNLASRITDLAHAGTIWAAQSVVELTAPSDLAWTPRGEHAVHGCMDPIVVFELDDGLSPSRATAP
jgi:adenylate cyclase